MVKFLKEYLKDNYIKTELVWKDFSSILLKLQVASYEFPGTVRTNARRILMFTSVFYILQCFSNTNTNNILTY